MEGLRQKRENPSPEKDTRVLGSAGPPMTVADLTHPPPAEKREPALGQHLALSSKSNGGIVDGVEPPPTSILWWISELYQNYFKTQTLETAAGPVLRSSFPLASFLRLEKDAVLQDGLAWRVMQLWGSPAAPSRGTKTPTNECSPHAPRPSKY